MLEERDLGVLMAVVTLLLGIVSRNYEGRPQACTGAVQQQSCSSCTAHIRAVVDALHSSV